MKTKLYLSAIFACLFSFVTKGQVQAVEWSAILDGPTDGTATVTVTGNIGEGWHIYGFEMPSLGQEAGVPDPTSITFELPEGVSLDGDLIKTGNESMHFDDFMNLNLPWIVGQVSFTQKFKVEKGASGSITGAVSYMSCTESSCTPPARYEFDLSIGGPAVAVQN